MEDKIFEFELWWEIISENDPPIAVRGIWFASIFVSVLLSCFDNCLAHNMMY